MGLQGAVRFILTSSVDVGPDLLRISLSVAGIQPVGRRHAGLSPYGKVGTPLVHLGGVLQSTELAIPGPRRTPSENATNRVDSDWTFAEQRSRG